MREIGLWLQILCHIADDSVERSSRRALLLSVLDCISLRLWALKVILEEVRPTGL